MVDFQKIYIYIFFFIKELFTTVELNNIILIHFILIFLLYIYNFFFLNIHIYISFLYFVIYIVL